MKAGRQTAAWKADSKEPVEEGRLADLPIRHSHSRSVPAGFLQYPEPCQRPDEIVRDNEGCLVCDSERMTYEMRLMAERFVGDGMIPEAGDVERLSNMLGRPVHVYREFATQMAASA